MICDFIKRRFPIDNNWCTGNCYWFAVILCNRFPDLTMWYFPIANHWMAGNKNGTIFYDWYGETLIDEIDEAPMLWSDMKEFDSLLYERLVKECIL